MAGRIREEDIAAVRERARIDDVISEYLTLRRAGGGSLKGLCPFHDEKTPSFNVNPARGFFHCFGCGEGGDVITFVMKLDGLGFSEAVERLGEKYGVELRREDEDGPRRPSGPPRSRLVQAHRIAEEFYRAALASPDALLARQFLAERGFDQAAAEHFGLGFAPRGGEELLRHLRQRGFSDTELVASGLIKQGRSHYDAFRGRLLWPIRESGGDPIGFGARRIFEDDRVQAKYLNTPETSIYKKSHVLYGLDLARRDIARGSQAVIVEGYTDVMACHLAGITTAVATCGTAFGEDHARVLRRFLADHEEFRGEVIFTFDGDAAGQAAAMKAFGLDQSFVSQTYVAVADAGMDPCDLRKLRGDEAVRELIATRKPLYRFVLGNVVAKYDLDRADGRIGALREGAALISSVRDNTTADEFAKELAMMIGVEIDQARSEVRRAKSQPKNSAAAAPTRGQPGAQEVPGSGQAHRGAPGVRTDGRAPRRTAVPNLRDPRFAIERETLKLVIQHPGSLGQAISGVGANDFSHPTYRSVWAAVESAGGALAGLTDPAWAGKMRSAATDPAVSAAIAELGTEPVRSVGEPTTDYTNAYLYRLQELTALRRIAAVKARLQRTNPVEQQEVYNKMFGELVALEQHRRGLRDLVMGSQD